MIFMDKTNSDFKYDWKTYSRLTVAWGQISTFHHTKKNIRALTQWVKDETRIGGDPSNTMFNIGGIIVPNLMIRQNTLDN